MLDILIHKRINKSNLPPNPPKPVLAVVVVDLAPNPPKPVPNAEGWAVFAVPKPPNRDGAEVVAGAVAPNPPKVPKPVLPPIVLFVGAVDPKPNADVEAGVAPNPPVLAPNPKLVVPGVLNVLVKFPPLVPNPLACGCCCCCGCCWVAVCVPNMDVVEVAGVLKPNVPVPLPNPAK